MTDLTDGTPEKGSTATITYLSSRGGEKTITGEVIKTTVAPHGHNIHIRSNREPPKVILEEQSNGYILKQGKNTTTRSRMGVVHEVGFR